jgi:hypothetical protein
MSSVGSSFAQVAPRDKYLLTIGTPEAGTGRTVSSGFTVTASMSDADFAAATASATPAAGLLYRDLGKTVTTYSPTTGLSTQKFVLAVRVLGANTEGANLSLTPVYLRVWAADATAEVSFVRTG